MHEVFIMLTSDCACSEVKGQGQLKTEDVLAGILCLAKCSLLGYTSLGNDMVAKTVPC